MTLVELCAGTAAVSLWALGRCVPLTGYMGSKRRWAPLLVDALGCDHPDRVVLVDAGPWGDAWTVLREGAGRRAVVDQLTTWAGTPDMADLWAYLVASSPPVDQPAWRVAQFLWLQARSAGTIPVWWSGTRWESPTGARTEAAHNRGGGALAKRQKGSASAIESSRRPGPAALGHRTTDRVRGIQTPATIARRIVALDRIDWTRVDVVHAQVSTVEPAGGGVVLLDPPYAGAPRYAALLPRAEVLVLAGRWATAGSRVAVCEAEPLPLPGWTSRRLPARKPEWITASWPIALPEQLPLFSEQAA